MRKTAATLHRLLTASARRLLGGTGAPRGTVFPDGHPRSRPSDQSDYVFRKYVAASVVIHVVVITALSISYRRAMKPAVPVGPYEVSLVEVEEPKPPPSKKRAAKRPKRTEARETVVPKEEKRETPVKIKPKPRRKPEVKKQEKRPEQKPETKPPTTKDGPPKKDRALPADSLVAKNTDAAKSPSVGGIQIDSPNFNFNYYLAMLQAKIQNNWRVPNGLPSGREGILATVKFTVRADGAITGVDVEKSSGLRFFDHSALRAVVNSNPAPPLPRAYDEDRLGVHVNFVFKEEAQ